MSTFRLIRLFFLVLVSAQLVVLGQECNSQSMKRCRQNVLDTLSTNSRSAKEDEQCSDLRENFDCLMWQTSMCLEKSEQDENRDAIMRTWRYLNSFCESQGSWYTKSCFQRSDVKNCESLLPPKGYTTDTSSCRSFNNFRSCVRPIVRDRCSLSDQKLFGTYIMEKGQQRAWNCPRTYNQFSPSQPASAPLADTDIRFTTLSEGWYGACSDESRYALQDCRTNFYNDRTEADSHNDSDMQHHKMCCALVKYEECVTNVLEDRCGERGKTEARNIVADMRNRYPNFSCNDHTTAECSSAIAISATVFIHLLITLSSMIIFI